MTRSLWVSTMVVTAATNAAACGYDFDGTAPLESLVETHAQRAAAGESPEELASLERRIDELAGAKDAAFSGLRWFKDLEQAKAEATKRRVPILSLRLLGELTSDRSCANSRFFRTALYANEALAAWLKQNVVLHWESVRPAPVITIDMGDGRKIERTIAGNSIHYLLLPTGEVVDALPGLYGPQAFREALEPGVVVARDVIRACRGGAQKLVEHQRAQLAILQREASGFALPVNPMNVGRDGVFPRADEAAPMAMGKCMVERPLLVAIGQPPPPDSPEWDAIAVQFIERCRLDARSKRLMARKVPAEERTGAAFDGLVASFEQVMAKDTAQNQLLLRPAILGLLIAGQRQVGPLNERVYAELFKTPGADAWLGLAPRDAYAGLEGGGLLQK